MTRRQLTDPFGSDDEEENIRVVDDKWCQSISITKSPTSPRDVNILKNEKKTQFNQFGFIFWYLMSL